jgi:hypothetical protein
VRALLRPRCLRRSVPAPRRLWQIHLPLNQAPTDTVTPAIPAVPGRA